MAEEDTGEDLVEVGFMAEVLEDILVVDGTEEAVTGEDEAITRTEDLATPTSVITLTTILTTLTGIGLLSVILMAGVTGSGCHIIEDTEMGKLMVALRSGEIFRCFFWRKHLT